MKLATIDVGTNTTLLLVAEGTGVDDVGASGEDGLRPSEPIAGGFGNPPRVPEKIVIVEDEAEITRLGRGIGGDGRLGREGIERTLAVLARYAALARQHGAAIAAVGTEALRRAPNAAEFLGPAEALLGAPIEVIGGEREAALSFLAASCSFPREAAGTMIVVDIGGGSTEVIVSRAGVVDFRRSLPLGSVRLTERHVHGDPAGDAEVAALVAEIAGALATVPLPQGAPLVGIAGTVTSLGAMAQRLTSYDPALVHGYRLTLVELERLVNDLRRSTQPERERMPGLDPRRADVILAGACILREIAQRSGAHEIIVSDRGIRWGLLYERLRAP
jgi:exopolyphosphatase / guanosine-5'-triphosphate,3'-diphosphate pyrophosphatase